MHTATWTTIGLGIRPQWRHLNHRVDPTRIYHVTDRLHHDRTADVPVGDIAATVSTWLAELGVHSPLAGNLVQAVRSGDWPATYALCERLSIDVACSA